MGDTVSPPNTINTARDLDLEARKILPRLAKDDANIRELPEPAVRAGREYGVFNRRNSFKKPVLFLAKTTVAGLHRLGLIEGHGEPYVISWEGIMWLRRQNANAAPYAEQHQLRRPDKREVDMVPRPVIVNDAESPLAWLHRRKDKRGEPLISAAQFQAGERLRSDYERGQLMPSTTASWEGMAPTRRQRRASPGSASGLSDSALAAHERVSHALSAVGPELSGILVDVCCHLMGLSQTEKGNGWPQRSGKIILQIALSRLARHYGIETDRKKSTDKAHIAHWGASNYRPTLAKWE